MRFRGHWMEGRLAKVDLKNILDDVRARDVALLGSIVALDRQALALFRIYVTLAVALGSAAVAGAYSSSGNVSAWIIYGAASAACGLAVACHFCIVTVRSAKLGVPGKNADFWRWAIRDDVTEQYLIEAYLELSEKAQQQNYSVNDNSTRSMRIAKRLGIASVLIGGVVALAGATGLGPRAWAALVAAANLG